MLVAVVVVFNPFLSCHGRSYLHIVCRVVVFVLILVCLVLAVFILLPCLDVKGGLLHPIK